MKKHAFLLTGLLIIFCSLVQASSVSEESAKNIALNFFKVTADSKQLYTATLNHAQKEADGTIDYYIFDITPGQGFVIVAGDDNITPVIAYSTESSFHTGGTHVGVSGWLNTTARTISAAIAQNISADSRIKNLWAAYSEGKNPNSSRASSVGPLLTTTWDQTPYYNELCPYNSTQQQLCVTGCVATTMAQIMKYWNYPRTGTGSYAYNETTYGRQTANFGSTTYNWKAMPNYLTGNNTEVATLMYQCGVSVEMNYGTAADGGSGAWVLKADTRFGSACAEKSFPAYFGYNPQTIRGVEHSDYSDADWIEILKSELDAGRPIQYQGWDANYGGHTWVCDGYNSNNMFHMNWGWGGQDDGYFNLNNLVAAGGLHFEYNDGALIGIEPLEMVEVSASATSPIICDGGTTDITATGPSTGTYTWTPATGLSCSTCATTTANPANTTTYTIIVDSAGVIGRAFVTVTVPKTTTADFSTSLISACSLPAAVAFTNNSNYTNSYFWDFGDGTTSTLAEPLHTYQDNNIYEIKLVATGLCGADSILKTSFINVTDHTPTVQGASDICGGQKATLIASGDGNITWYKAATGGSAVGTGDSYTTPALNKTTTYYVAATIPGQESYVGAPDNTIGAGNYYTGANELYLTFNCTEAQTLVSVDVYAKTAGSRTISLVDSNGYQLQVSNVYVPAGFQTVVLNMAVPAANKLKLTIEGYVDLYRSTAGATYPYLSEDGTLSITGSSSSNKNYYYFFYNWKLQLAPCTTNRIPVVAEVNSLSASIKADHSGLQGRTVKFTPVNSTATSFKWEFGDGATSTEKTPTHTYNNTIAYLVRLTESNGTCTDQLEHQLFGATAIEDPTTLVQGFKLSPVPTGNTLNVNIQCTEHVTNARLAIYNLLGEVIMNRETNLTEGTNTVSLDVSSLPAGIYISSLQTGRQVTSLRFVKAD